MTAIGNANSHVNIDCITGFFRSNKICCSFLITYKNQNIDTVCTTQQDLKLKQKTDFSYEIDLMIEIEIYDFYNELLQYNFEVTGYRNKIKLVPSSWGEMSAMKFLNESQQR